MNCIGPVSPRRSRRSLAVARDDSRARGDNASGDGGLLIVDPSVRAMSSTYPHPRRACRYLARGAASKRHPTRRRARAVARTRYGHAVGRRCTTSTTDASTLRDAWARSRGPNPNGNNVRTERCLRRWTERSDHKRPPTRAVPEPRELPSRSTETRGHHAGRPFQRQGEAVFLASVAGFWKRLEKKRPERQKLPHPRGSVHAVPPRLPTP